MKGLFSDAPFTFAGQHYSVSSLNTFQAAGERFEEIELSMVASVIITDHRQEAAKQFARDRGWRAIAADEVLTMPSVFIGTVDHIVDEMQGRRARYGISYYVFFDHLMDRVAPLVTRLAGE